MGTRADFYVGKGENAEWIGSIAWDGYREGVGDSILNAKTETQYIDAVKQFFRSREDVSLPSDGWPWPWNDSSITDCSYWFFEDQVWDELSGKYLPCSEDMPDEESEDFDRLDDIEFPDMSDKKNVQWGEKSGLIVVTAN
ncbi:MAG: hypothetical protein ACR2MX_01675 [Cyclobacteriaceae bacterium]